MARKREGLVLIASSTSLYSPENIAKHTDLNLFSRSSKDDGDEAKSSLPATQPFSQRIQQQQQQQLHRRRASMESLVQSDAGFTTTSFRRSRSRGQLVIINPDGTTSVHAEEPTGGTTGDNNKSNNSNKSNKSNKSNNSNSNNNDDDKNTKSTESATTASPDPNNSWFARGRSPRRQSMKQASGQDVPDSIFSFNDSNNDKNNNTKNNKKWRNKNKSRSNSNPKYRKNRNSNKNPKSKESGSTTTNKNMETTSGTVTTSNNNSNTNGDGDDEIKGAQDATSAGIRNFFSDWGSLFSFTPLPTVLSSTEAAATAVAAAPSSSSPAQPPTPASSFLHTSSAPQIHPASPPKLDHKAANAHLSNSTAAAVSGAATTKFVSPQAPQTNKLPYAQQVVPTGEQKIESRTQKSEPVIANKGETAAESSPQPSSFFGMAEAATAAFRLMQNTILRAPDGTITNKDKTETKYFPTNKEDAKTSSALPTMLVTTNKDADHNSKSQSSAKDTNAATVAKVNLDYSNKNQESTRPSSPVMEDPDDKRRAEKEGLNYCSTKSKDGDTTKEPRSGRTGAASVALKMMQNGGALFGNNKNRSQQPKEPSTFKNRSSTSLTAEMAMRDQAEQTQGFPRALPKAKKLRERGDRAQVQTKEEPMPKENQKQEYPQAFSNERAPVSPQPMPYASSAEVVATRHSPPSPMPNDKLIQPSATLGSRTTQHDHDKNVSSGEPEKILMDWSIKPPSPRRDTDWSSAGMSRARYDAVAFENLELSLSELQKAAESTSTSTEVVDNRSSFPPDPESSDVTSRKVDNEATESVSGADNSSKSLDMILLNRDDNYGRQTQPYCEEERSTTSSTASSQKGLFGTKRSMSRPLFSTASTQSVRRGFNLFRPARGQQDDSPSPPPRPLPSRQRGPYVRAFELEHDDTFTVNDTSSIDGIYAPNPFQAEPFQLQQEDSPSPPPRPLPSRQRGPYVRAFELEHDDTFTGNDTSSIDGIFAPNPFQAEPFKLQQEDSPSPPPRLFPRVGPHVRALELEYDDKSPVHDTSSSINEVFAPNPFQAEPSPSRGQTTEQVQYDVLAYSRSEESQEVDAVFEAGKLFASGPGRKKGRTQKTHRNVSPDEEPLLLPTQVPALRNEKDEGDDWKSNDMTGSFKTGSPPGVKEATGLGQQEASRLEAKIVPSTSDKKRSSGTLSNKVPRKSSYFQSQNSFAEYQTKTEVGQNEVEIMLRDNDDESAAIESVSLSTTQSIPPSTSEFLAENKSDNASNKSTGEDRTPGQSAPRGRSKHGDTNMGAATEGCLFNAFSSANKSDYSSSDGNEQDFDDNSDNSDVLEDGCSCSSSRYDAVSSSIATTQGAKNNASFGVGPIDGSSRSDFMYAEEQSGPFDEQQEQQQTLHMNELSTGSTSSFVFDDKYSLSAVAEASIEDDDHDRSSSYSKRSITTDSAVKHSFFATSSNPLKLRKSKKTGNDEDEDSKPLFGADRYFCATNTFENTYHDTRDDVNVDDNTDSRSAAETASRASSHANLPHRDTLKLFSNVFNSVKDGSSRRSRGSTSKRERAKTFQLPTTIGQGGLRKIVRNHAKLMDNVESQDDLDHDADPYVPPPPSSGPPVFLRNTESSWFALS
ncbi:hypothetical protein ACA910_022533 [Epithemia clementina (nom. ined.)]